MNILICLVVFQLLHLSANPRELTLEEKNLILNNRLDDIRAGSDTTTQNWPQLTEYDNSNKRLGHLRKNHLTDYQRQVQEQTRKRYEAIERMILKAENSQTETEQDVMLKQKAPDVQSMSRKDNNGNKSETSSESMSSDNDLDSNTVVYVLDQLEPKSKSAPPLGSTDNGNKTGDQRSKMTSDIDINAEVASKESDDSDEDLMLKQFVVNQNETTSAENKSETDLMTTSTQSVEVSEATNGTTHKEQRPHKLVPQMFVIFIVLEFIVIGILVICWSLSAYYSWEEMDIEGKLLAEGIAPATDSGADAKSGVANNKTAPNETSKKLVIIDNTKSPQMSESSAAPDDGLAAYEDAQTGPPLPPGNPPKIVKTESMFAKPDD